MAEKKVTLRFDVADGNASSTLNRIASEADKAAKSTEALQRAFQNGGKLPYGATGGYTNPLAPTSPVPGLGPAFTGAYSSVDTLRQVPMGANNNLQPLIEALTRLERSISGLDRSTVAQTREVRQTQARATMDMAALSGAGYRAPGAGMNMAALSGSNLNAGSATGFGAYRPDSLTTPQNNEYRPWYEQTMYGNEKLPWEPNKRGGMLSGVTGMVAAGGSRMIGAAMRVAPYAAAVDALAGVAEGANRVGLIEAQGGNAGEMGRAMANSTLVSRQVLGWADSFRGRQTQLDLVNYQEQIRNTGRQSIDAQRAFGFQASLERNEFAARSNVLAADQRVQLIGNYDRGTVLGEREFQRQSMLQAPRQGVFEAEKELGVERAIMLSRMSSADQAAGRMARLETERGQLQANIDTSSGDQKNRFIRQEEQKRNEIQKANEELRQLNQGVEQSRERIAQLKGSVAQARIGVMRADLGVLEQREGVAAGQAQRVGRMNALDYASSRQAVDMVKQFGIDALPDDIIAQAERLAPELVGKRFEQRGAARNAADNVGRVEGFEDVLPDIRQQVTDAKNGIAKAMRDAIAEIAKEQADQLRGQEFADAMKRLIRAEFDGQRQGIENAAKEKNLRGGS
jgi:hypothetical protein